jgi:hypothetical protein
MIITWIECTKREQLIAVLSQKKGKPPVAADCFLAPIEQRVGLGCG